MYQQVLDPVGGSLGLSAIFAVLPLATLFVLLGGLRMKAHWASLIALAVALAVATIAYPMPVGQALDAAALGAVFGLFPIMWIVVNAIWLYNMTTKTGHFEVLRRSFGAVSPDQRVQAIVIAFSFGALLEALAGFGTPVAITAVMLIALGFKPVKAASVALVANTAPVAFGALAIPIITLAEVTGLPQEDLGAMVGRQTPFLAVIVPLILVGMVDGRRGLRQAWLPAAVGGLSFALGQFAASNYFSVELADVVAALVSAGAIIALLRVWSPSEPLIGEASGGGRPAVAGAEAHDPKLEAEVRRREGEGGDSRRAVAVAYAPYLILIAVFSIAQIGPVNDALNSVTAEFPWPGLNVVDSSGEAPDAATFTFNWLEGTGTLVLIAGLITAPIPHRGATGAQDLRRVARPAQVGDPHGGRGARPRLRDEPLGPDDHARAVRRRSRLHLRPDRADRRLARRRGDGLGHLVERAVRGAPAARRARGRPRPGADHGRLELGRSARQGRLAAEPGHRCRRGRHGRAGGRPVPPGHRLEPPAAGAHVRDRLLQSTPVLSWLVV